VDTEQKTLDRIIEGGIYFLLLFTPVAFSTVEFWSESVMELGIFFIFVIWFIKAFTSKKLSFSITYFDILLLFFISVITIQIIPIPSSIAGFFSTDSFASIQELKSSVAGNSFTTISLVPWSTRVELIKILSYVMIYFVIVNYFSSFKQVERLIIILLIIGAAESVYGIVQYLSGDEMLFNYTYLDHQMGRLSGTFPSPDHFSAYLKMCVFTGLGYLMYLSDIDGLFKKEKKKKTTVEVLKNTFAVSGKWEGQAAVLLAVVLMSVALVFTKSRSGIMNLALGLICLSVFVKIKFSSKKFIKLVAIILFITIVVGVWMGITPVFDRYLDLNPNDVLEEGRFSVWMSTYNIFKDYPLLGSGYGSFVYIYPSYTTRTNQGWVNHAHNDWLELLSDTGIVGFLIVLAAFILLSTKELLKAFSSSKDKIIYLYFGLYMAIFSIAVHCLTDFNLRTTANSFLLAVLTALYVKLGQSYELNVKKEYDEK